MTKKYKDIDQLAERITAHLKRFEAMPRPNRPLNFYRNARAYYGPDSSIIIEYVSQWGINKLTIDEATRYLAWLDAGNVGKHWEALKDGGEA